MHVGRVLLRDGLCLQGLPFIGLRWGMRLRLPPPLTDASPPGAPVLSLAALPTSASASARAADSTGTRRADELAEPVGPSRARRGAPSTRRTTWNGFALGLANPPPTVLDMAAAMLKGSSRGGGAPA